MKPSEYIDKLKIRGSKFESGLTDSEFEEIENTCNFKFPPDLRDFLSIALPINDDWINWRNWTKKEITDQLSWPYEGICFDIEHNSFWRDEWGKKPNTLKECFKVAKEVVNNAPTLIPIYSHRFIPDTPHEAGNPVFSVYQTDIIYYGTNLYNYLRNEFSSTFGKPENPEKNDFKDIKFWTKLVEIN